MASQVFGMAKKGVVLRVAHRSIKCWSIIGMWLARLTKLICISNAKTESMTNRKAESMTNAKANWYAFIPVWCAVAYMASENACWDIECLLAGEAKWPISSPIPIPLSDFFPCAICIYLPTFISLVLTIALFLLSSYLQWSSRDSGQQSFLKPGWYITPNDETKTQDMWVYKDNAATGNAV